MDKRIKNLINHLEEREQNNKLIAEQFSAFIKVLYQQTKAVLGNFTPPVEVKIASEVGTQFEVLSFEWDGRLITIVPIGSFGYPDDNAPDL
ncbi:MAG: hypothetical protein CL608_01885 [Anaerolineaceae bacterium]|nr:hypothetical protein [Anaerolineaceae bacterium]